MIAPAVPAAPQGSTTGDAVAFEGMLAAMLNGEAGTEADVEADAAKAGDEDLAADAVLTAPVAPPPSQPLLVVTAEETGSSVTAPAAAQSSDEQSDGGTRAEADTAAPAAANDATTEPAPPTSQSSTVQASVQSAQPSAKDAAAVAAALALKTSEADTAEAPAADNDDMIAARKPETTDKPAAPPAGATPPPAQPAPLRPLAERTARQQGEGSTAEQAQTTATASAASAPAGSPQEATPAAPGNTNGQVDAAPAIVIDNTPADTSDQPVEGQAAEAAPQTASAATVREVTAPVMSRTAIEATVQIAAQIQRRLEGRNTRFEIALTPDELGRVDVRLDIDAEGRLAARLAFDNPAAAADLRGRADELRRQLEQFGFQLADDAFEFAERDSGSSAFDRGQDARDGQSRAFARATRLNMDAEAATLAPRWTNHSLTPSGVDLKV